MSSTEDDGIQKTQKLDQSQSTGMTKKAKDSRSLFTREFEKLQTITNNKRPRSPSPMQENADNSIDDCFKSQNKECSCKSEYKKLKIYIKNLRSEINVKLDNHFNSFKEMISSFPNKLAADDQYPHELWYNDINLLDYGAPNIQKYISKLMDELYSEQEMGESYVIDGASTSKKKALDLERLLKIRDAVYIKYRVPNGKKNEYWEIVKDKACRKCLDVAKKIRIK
ncbi:unnamed protein product [Brachionus calyciflorus]|uniref:BEN domain-containing protein n=1 Tax=Brachionus calyciflorus TaxID=104777 RepID=A0A814LN87_9BILA|nr:unnamed protein product [Brachionus calyciflorus]